MGTAEEFSPEKLVIGVLLSRPELRAPLLAALRAGFGPVDLEGEEREFTCTRYYDAEMGTPIRRFLLSFERLVSPASLAEIKGQTNRLEDLFREGGRRRVNLDPGILSLSRFILASTKDSSHRVPLADGIYAEVTLMYERGEFRPVEWTYPDYRDPVQRAVLKEIRRLYARQLQAGGR
jgi:hypothetical protein